MQLGGNRGGLIVLKCNSVDFLWIGVLYFHATGYCYLGVITSYDKWPDLEVSEREHFLDVYWNVLSLDQVSISLP